MPPTGHKIKPHAPAARRFFGGGYIGHNYTKARERSKGEGHWD